jgi:hypothetical protein
VTGYPTQTRSFRTRVQADVWALSTEVRAKGGTLVVSQKMTLGELIDEVRPRLKSPFDAALEYWKSELGHLRLRYVSPALIAQHRDALLDAEIKSHGHRTTKPRSATTTWHYLQSLSRVFTVAQKELHLLDANPVAQVQRPSLPRGRMPSIGDGRALRVCSDLAYYRRRKSEASFYQWIGIEHRLASRDD